MTLGPFVRDDEAYARGKADAEAGAFSRNPYADSRARGRIESGEERARRIVRRRSYLAGYESVCRFGYSEPTK